MIDRGWGSMDEQDFDAALQNSLSELPPEEIAAEVTPWKRAMDRILVGTALLAVTLNFWYLDTILPAVGMVLSLLGFRALRGENRWFRSCFVITVLRAAYFLPLLILNTTILPSLLPSAGIASALTVVNLCCVLAEFFFLWRGLRAVQQKAGLPPRAGGAAALMLWYLLLCLLAVLPYRGLLLAGAMLVGYFFILRSLFRLSKELEEAAYAVRPVPVKISDRSIVLAIVLVLITGCALGYRFGGSYPMDWQIVEPSEHAATADIQEQLLALGFPDYVLDDLTCEDIAACANAVRVVVDVTTEPVNDGRSVITESIRGGVHHIEHTTVYDVRELQITGVGVQIAGERETWILFHHFLWTVDPGFYGTEAIQLWPVYRDISEGWASAGEVTGRVLFDRDGKTLSAPYYFLGKQTFASNSLFWGEQTNTNLLAAFSMPTKGERYRGYVAYPVAEAQDGYIISSWFNYTHQRSWLQYPAATAMETSMKNSWRDAGAFRTIQDALQFYPTEEGIELIN